MKPLLLISLSLILSGCASVSKKATPVQFFQGKASDDCEFLGYIESESQMKTEEESVEACKQELYAQSAKYKANALKLVNVNRVVTKINMSAEAYRCSSLIQLKRADEHRINFDF